MDQELLLAKIAAGYGNVARRLGAVCAHYRPVGGGNPIGDGNQLASLPVFFTPVSKTEEGALWIAAMDYGGTAAGDYLVTEAGDAYFVAAQPDFAPIVCVRTNAVIGLTRPDEMAAIGAGYSGVVAGQGAALLVGWPAALNVAGRGRAGDLPDDLGEAAWKVMLPQIPVVPLIGDLLADDRGRNFVVVAAEATNLGWQLHVKQVSS